MPLARRRMRSLSNSFPPDDFCETLHVPTLVFVFAPGGGRKTNPTFRRIISKLGKVMFFATQKRVTYAPFFSLHNM